MDANTFDNFFLECFENASEQWRNEIYDIYFGAVFACHDITYGDTMGRQAGSEQYKNLLKIQEKYGIPISLTLNEMVRPVEMIRTDVIKQFISFIRKYYDDGVRSCTISHVHLMAKGALQSAFPDMIWKNTVNHAISSTQEMVDYAALGYNTIQLDRKFNRNLNELKRTKKEADRLGVKTCLLIREACMPECPFKTEHDVWQGGKYLRQTGLSYWDVAGGMSCNSWLSRPAGQLGPNEQHLKEKDKAVFNPRTATDILVHSKEDWDDFADNVDIFKLAGRHRGPNSQMTKNAFGYFFEMWKDPEKQHEWPERVNTNMFKTSSFKEIYENNLAPLFMWFSRDTYDANYPLITDIDKIKEGIANHFWNREEGKHLCKTLKRCKNQCYACHECDDLFGTGRVDSILKFEKRLFTPPWPFDKESLTRKDNFMT